MAIIDRLNLLLRSEWNKNKKNREYYSLEDAKQALVLLAEEEQIIRRKYQNKLDQFHRLETQIAQCDEKNQRERMSRLLKGKKLLRKSLDEQRRLLDSIQADYFALQNLLHKATHHNSEDTSDKIFTVKNKFQELTETLQHFDDAAFRIETMENEAEAMRELNEELDQNGELLQERINKLNSRQTLDPLERLRKRMNNEN